MEYIDYYKLLAVNSEATIRSNYHELVHGPRTRVQYCIVATFDQHNIRTNTFYILYGVNEICAKITRSNDNGRSPL